MLTAVTGINWGDEGKGRVIDLLAENADIVARYQGGNNAGHTVVTEKGKFILNLLPSGILHPEVTCVLGTGMVVDLDHLAGEMAAIEERGVEISPKNLKLSDKATISMPWHKVQDGLEEDRLAKNGTAFGSTRRGIAYAYSDKYRKKTLRLGDLLHLDEERTQNRLHMILDSKNMELAGCYHQEKMSYDALFHWCEAQAAKFAPYICDVGAFLQQAHDSGKRIVLEAQLGAMRDIDYGIFPFTSSSNTLAAYAPLGAGIPNCKLDHVVGVLKAYSTCVGAGPFAAENAMGEDWNEQLRKAGGEYGAATGRPRRVGPIDLVASRDLRLQIGDKLTIVGEANSVNNVGKILGDELKRLDNPNLLAIFVGLTLGVLIGAIPIAIPGMSTPIKLGIAGGPIIVGILMGAFGPRFHLTTYTTQSANLMMRQFGIVIYLAGLGIDSGAHFFETVFRAEGLLWIGLGFLLTIVPVLIVGFIASQFFKLDYAHNIGMLCGSMANPMALSYANTTVEGDEPSVSYATVYPLSMFIRVISAQLLIMLFT